MFRRMAVQSGSPPRRRRRLSDIATHTKIVYGLVSLAVLWIIGLTAAIVFSNNQERNEISEPAKTGFAYIDGVIRYFESISQAEFSPAHFLSVEFWSIYVTIFLAALGAFGGLFRLYAKIRALPANDVSAEKRENVLLLACAALTVVIFGTTTVLASVRKRHLLNRFYVLEVHLVRFEGLMFNSMAISAKPNLLDTFFVYMIGYIARIQKLLTNLERSYDFTDRDDIDRVMREAVEAVNKLKARGFVDNEEIGDMVFADAKGDNTLLELLRNLEHMQESVRRHIRRLER